MFRKLFHALFKRAVIVGLLILLQILALIFAIVKLSEYFTFLYSALTAINLVLIVWLINTKNNPAYKFAWAVLILLCPLFGGVFYILFGIKRHTSFVKRRMKNNKYSILQYLPQSSNAQADLKQHCLDVCMQSSYIQDRCGFPVYRNTSVQYFGSGEEKFEYMVKELKKAKHFIFLEYFIINNGVMWDTILQILKQKVAEGVDVRLIYDDCGCMNLLPVNYHKTLEAMGIKVFVFNPFRPILSITMNNRDHRKILVIDGHTAFTGGINIADEYINACEKYGHWKDAAVMLKGEACYTLTFVFLQMWSISGRDNPNDDLSKYMPCIYHDGPFEDDGFVQPYADSPADDENVAEYVYMNMINKAKKYVYITTPYLILDNEIITALCLAAKNGVDVRIITPYVYDKWYVHMVTRSYYEQLVSAGVKIYEYTPGFIHSKTFVSDDEVGIVGTINLDYRSLYMHFECGVWMYKSKAVEQLYTDYMQTLGKCREITLADCKKVSLPVRVLRGVLKGFAPIM